MAKGRWTCF